MVSNFSNNKNVISQSHFRNWFELMVIDHGFLRIWWHNFHKVDNNLWRSNQPTPNRIKKAAHSGVKTIVNLRGERNDGGWQLEADACEKLGIQLIDFTARSRAAPDKKMLFQSRDLFSSIKFPALIHCKSGADRAGLMSALYLIIVKNSKVSEAIKQLSFRYGHIKYAKTGLLDRFFYEYLPFQKKGVPFFDWVEKDYNPKKIENDFKTSKLADIIINDIFKRE